MNRGCQEGFIVEGVVRIVVQVQMQVGESDRLEGEIKRSLAGLGYDV